MLHSRSRLSQSTCRLYGLRPPPPAAQILHSFDFPHPFLNSATMALHYSCDLFKNTRAQHCIIAATAWIAMAHDTCLWPLEKNVLPALILEVHSCSLSLLERQGPMQHFSATEGTNGVQGFFPAFSPTPIEYWWPMLHSWTPSGSEEKILFPSRGPKRRMV
jgi:hypothetical protein